MVQLAATAIMNGYVVGFARGEVFTGATKAACVPVLNCHSCPGALGSCPIGALQQSLAGAHAQFPFYVLGTLMLFGTLFGRLLCGFLCPFGLVQDLLHRIPARRLNVPRRLDKALRWLKFVVLGLLVVLLPLLAVNDYGIGRPWFCEFLCPAGTLQAGIPLMLANAPLRASAGLLFDWKIAVLAALLVLSVFVYRPFCKYLCPLGAFYSLFNRFSLYQMRVDLSKCTGCGSCARACKMQVEMPQLPREDGDPAPARPGDGCAAIESGECIRCGACKAACPEGAIAAGFGKAPSPKSSPTA